ncbi:MAG: sulfotransferase domain-containing protein [Trueperaceae bacterium]|nr:MAG: sulfotransferase domain-containing protein [Trueperaceae bacterium]
MIADSRPQVLHTYQNHILDSTRWKRYRPREDDIVISTSIKSGTTWMQSIVVNLVFQGKDVPSPGVVSPWIGIRLRPLDEMIAMLEAQQHRRVIKSHLALDGLPFYDQVKYIVVARDTRDVFMSLYNHYSNYTEEAQAFKNADLEGEAFPECPDDIRVFWSDWITRGWFEWESEGYPYWGNLHHTKTWWEYRHLPNIMFVHYNDLLADLPGEIVRVAEYLDIPVGEEVLTRIVEAVSFDSMKKNADFIAPHEAQIFKGGGQTFIHKGTNGRWREVLTKEDLELYIAAMKRVVSPECAEFLEHGRSRL